MKLVEKHVYREARTLYDAGRYQEALSHFLRVVEEGGSHWQVAWRLVKSAAIIGQLKQAVHDVTLLVKRWPESLDPDAFLRLIIEAGENLECSELRLKPVKNQEMAFSPRLLRELAQKFEVDVFVETGTFKGDTAFLAAGIFDEVHTIELSEDLHRAAVQRFASQDNVFAHLGDSAKVFPELLPQLQGTVLYWLDGHFSEGVTAQGEKNTPILEELRAIRQLGKQDCVVMVDDLRLFQDESLIYRPSLRGYPTIGTLRAEVSHLFDDPVFIVLGDSALAFNGKERIAVSSVLEACTVSRSYESDQAPELVIAAEETISEAAGEEREAILALVPAYRSMEEYGHCFHFRLWNGLVTAVSGNPEDAIEDFEKAIELGCDHWRVHWYKAQIAQALGNREQAFGELQHVLNVCPGFKPAQDLLGELRPEASSSARLAPGANTRDQLIQAGVWQEGRPLRLHLGCGEQRLTGYINIDYPSDSHSVMRPQVDFTADIQTLDFPANSVDEIRLHHVFEHFPRVTALALLIKWHSWLKSGGKLHIETPDLTGSAKTLLSSASVKTKMGVVRHLAGDQADAWAFHVDHWFPERFERTLLMLGFQISEVRPWSWPHEPYLSNVEVIALKSQERTPGEQLAAAEELLWDSTVSETEVETHQRWISQLRRLLEGERLELRQDDSRLFPSVDFIESQLNPVSTATPLSEIYDFNQQSRDAWVKAQAALIPAGSKVLDVGAGTCPYRPLFAHCTYVAQDFAKYEGVKLGGGNRYGNIDITSDITRIPVEDGEFDAVLCTEVLEHVPEPIEALREMVRVLKPGGRLILTAPLGSGRHQLPYHFYGGYTPEWYQHFFEKFGVKLLEVTPNGGFFKLLAQECARVAWTLPQHQHLHGDQAPFINHLFGEWLPRYLFELEKHCFIDQFTVGYHVIGLKE